MCSFKLFLSGHSLNRWCKLSVNFCRPVMVKSVTTEVLLRILVKRGKQFIQRYFVGDIVFGVVFESFQPLKAFIVGLL